MAVHHGGLKIDWQTAYWNYAGNLSDNSARANAANAGWWMWITGTPYNPDHHRALQTLLNQTQPTG